MFPDGLTHNPRTNPVCAVRVLKHSRLGKFHKRTWKNNIKYTIFSLKKEISILARLQFYFAIHLHNTELNNTMLCFLSCSSNVKINSGWVFWSCLWHFLVQARYTYSYLFDDLQWGTKLLGQLIWFAVISPLSPQPPSNVVVCAGLYTLPCPKRVSSFQHCLEGGGEGHSQYPHG